MSRFIVAFFFLPVVVVAFFLGSLVNATAPPNGFQTFISNESTQPASNGQANDFYIQIDKAGFNPCYNSSSYKSGAVNGMDGGQAWTSVHTWLGEQAGTQTWRDRSNQLIRLINGELTNTPGIQLQATSDEEGLCSYMVRMADDIGIPVTGTAVVVDNEAENKAYSIGQIADKCAEAFATESDGFIDGRTSLTSFLTGLSTADYNSIVKPVATSIATSPDPSTQCTDLAGDLSSQIAAVKNSFCETNPQDASCVAGEEDEDAVTCTVEGVGWIICPVLTFMGGIVDAAYGFVAGLLTVQPFMTTGNTEGAYNAWVVMRNVANIAFVLAFLIIIFSQLTSVGISNYGVKKMLPRLVVAAVLVNASFWISAIAVDLSNIFGRSMIGIFEGLNDQIKIPAVTTDGIGDAADGSTVWANLVGFIIAGGATGVVIYYVGLSALIPALLAAFVAIVTVFLVLTLRQALIILLVVISPLAFVAYLLPNTEDLFTKWRKLFMTLLLMYPIIAGLFGASALASNIVMNGTTNTIVQIMGAAIAILPLALTPVIMKTAGGVLNRFAGIVNNAEKGPIDGLRNAGEKYRKSRRDLRDTRAMAGGRGSTQLGRGAFKRWRGRREAVANSRAGKLNEAKNEYIADRATESASFRNSMAGGTIGQKADPADVSKALANATVVVQKAELEDISAVETLIRAQHQDPSELIGVAAAELSRAIARGDTTSARAAQKILLNTGGPGLDRLHVELENSFDTQGASKTSETGSKLRQDLSAAGLKGKDAVIDNWATNDARTGIGATFASNVSAGLNDVELAGQRMDGVLIQAEQQRHITQDQARAVVANESVFKDMDQGKKALFQRIADGVAPPPLDARGRPVIVPGPAGQTGNTGQTGQQGPPGTPGPAGGAGGAPATPQTPPPATGSGPGGMFIPGDNGYRRP